MITILEKVRKLEEYLVINNSNIDPLIEVTINKLLFREVNRMLEIKTRLSNELIEFEKRYIINSDDFYKRYESGNLGDEMDFIEWSATIEMLNNLKQQLELLEPILTNEFYYY